MACEWPVSLGYPVASQRAPSDDEEITIEPKPCRTHSEDEVRKQMPFILPEAQGHSANTCLGHHSAVAVLRHGERQDSVFGSAWHGTEDFQRYPFDCPITDHAVWEAQHAAHQLRNFADFHVIVSSPYLRCVQTAVALADALDARQKALGIFYTFPC